MRIHTHILGYPRIGKNRELKKTIEGYWSNRISIEELRIKAAAIEETRHRAQEQMDIHTRGDFSLYDHILDTSLLFGNIPKRFTEAHFSGIEDLQFAMARGVQKDSLSISACGMQKWFDTNYHYIVPELAEDTDFCFDPDLCRKRYGKFEEESKSGKKAVVCGPLTYLWIGEKTGSGSFSRLELLPSLLKEYRRLFAELKQMGYSWVQADEPAAVLDYLPKAWRRAYRETYASFHAVPLSRRPKVLFTTYFDTPLYASGLIKSIPCEGCHLDAVRIETRAEHTAFKKLVSAFPQDRVISLGVLSGRNIWKSDLKRTAALISSIMGSSDAEVWISPSTSLLHVPVTKKEEKQTINEELYEKLSFADEKIQELIDLKSLLITGNSFSGETIFRDSTPPARIPAHNKRLPFSKRNTLQQQTLGLPPLPATTIGSFPQTGEIRRARRDLKSGKIGTEEYEQVLKTYIHSVIRKQEELGLDVLVHGEPERNDMVEYFSESLDGMTPTASGWVQSYGTRCVKPPIIYADISRPGPVTLKWINYAASLTDKPVKGMLTGPVTLVKWSFPREDISLEEQFYQAACAVAAEVEDLEKSGISIIQIDEAAFREAQPPAKREWRKYRKAAARAFRIASSRASDATQIHTHMCYSDFSSILKGVRDMDADVLTIETSRSEMKLLEQFTHTKGFNHFGPGVYDIHSPAVPQTELIAGRIKKALRYLGPGRLWINPDCGLKTRGWPETEQALENMMTAVKAVRETTIYGDSA